MADPFDSPPGQDARGGEQRLFDMRMRKLCWEKATIVPGRDPSRWRADPAGNVVCARLTSCDGPLCHQYDHIVPFSKGGKTEVSNCQILQSRVNLLKSNKVDVPPAELHSYSVDIKFSDRELDLVELAVYGNIKKEGVEVRTESKRAHADAPACPFTNYTCDATILRAAAAAAAADRKKRS